ncbi:MAG: UbiA prenyltransferase family protein, partial [Candidatus Thermoplasmatota archaeon]|nr:UbiA prenyltransferase family protein [Candidatus Thermoplasmatota archaeon]
VPGIAAYISGGSLLTVTSVVVGSVLHHAWAFSLNEVIDLEIDRRNPELSHKPLVSGKVSKKVAWTFSLGALVLSLIFFSFGAFIGEGTVLHALAFLFLGTLTGSIYDLYGKRFPLSDIFVAFWMFFLVMAGAGAVSGWGPYPLGVWALAALAPLHILFNNSVEGGLKDVENDRESGARTLAVFFGVRLRNGYLKVPRSFLLWGLFLRASFVIGASVFVLFLAEDARMGEWITVVVPLAGLLIIAHSLTFLGRGVRMDRGGLIRTFALHEVASFGLSMLVILPAAGWVAAGVAFMAPLIWVLAFNRLIFRTRLAPRV